MSKMDEGKKKIIELFDQNVRGKQPNIDNQNKSHDGKYGHWLEQQMGIQANNRTEADLYGYEMKNHTTSGKTTFGDWSANYYIFKDRDRACNFKGVKIIDRRNSFLEIFGQLNEEKQCYSWSGKPVPNIKDYNDFGQKLIVDPHNNILAQYSYSKDTRNHKATTIPSTLQIEDLTLARWDSASLEKRVEKKFNVKGWFKCVKNKQGIYSAIEFGRVINFEEWIREVKKGVIFFDSGMYQGNNRPYSQWRANNTFWDSLIVDRY